MDFLKVALARLRIVSTPKPTATPSQCPSRVTVGKLSDEVLLKIFCYYLDASPRFWPTLGHICRRWRRIVFSHFRLRFTHGAPVSKRLDCRPALPIVVEYGGSPRLDSPAPEDEDNIMAALKQSDRVSFISLTVTSSLLERLSAIERPFSELEGLVLLSQDDVGLPVPVTLPSAFRWGERLRCLHSTGIAFPALLELLHSSKNLVDLQLHKVLNSSHFSPEALTNALSGMAQLQSLSLHFLSTAYYLDPPPPSGKRVVLPVLTRLNFRGNTEYLEGLVTRIDAPRLEHIEVTFSNINTLDLSKFSEFIDRIEMHKLHRRAYLLSSERAISLSLTQPGTSTCFTLQLFCKPFSEQLCFMAHICIRFSALLSNIEDLRISVMRPSSTQDVNDRKRWPGVIYRFEGGKRFHVAGDYPTNIVLGVQLSEAVLPALHMLFIPQPGPRHAALREALVSLMTSRRLSGHPIAVEYERLRHIRELRDMGPFSQQVTIEMLCEDILLNIFCHYLDATPRSWPTLARVCQRWQHVVFTSPLGLNLRLYCTYGTPVLKTLECWTALPIIVQYGGIPNFDPPAPKEHDNIVAALKQSGRVISISLTVTSALFEKLSVISEPFSELEELAIVSQDNMPLTLPSTFRWGPRLRTLHSTRIVLPSFPQLLSLSQDLVYLRLHEIPGAGYFSPEAFADALSGMTQLRKLSLHFLSLPPRRNYVGLPPQPGGRTVLPALIHLKYRGISKYLDSLVARIDAPRLGNIDITFFGQPTMDASQLGRFIERIDMQRSLSQADIQASADAISLSFTNSAISTPLLLQISCKQLDWQLFSMAQILNQISHFLFLVENLGIDTTESPLGQDNVGGEQWRELLRAFRSAKDFRVAGVHVTDILCALRPADGGHPTDTTVLPSLRNLRLHVTVLWDAAESFITSRHLSGRPVQVDALSYRCHICAAVFGEQQEVKKHIADKHRYRVCSYCDDFRSTPDQNDRFLTHLATKHPEGFRNHMVFTNPSSPPTNAQLIALVYRHSSPLAPDIDAPAGSTTVPASHS